MFGILILLCHGLYSEDYQLRDFAEEAIKRYVILTDNGPWLSERIRDETDLEARRRLLRCQWSYRNVGALFGRFPRISSVEVVENDRLTEDPSTLPCPHLREIVGKIYHQIHWNNEDEISRWVTREYCWILFEYGWTRGEVVTYLQRGLDKEGVKP